MCAIITGTSKRNQKWRWDVSCKEAVKVDVVDGNKMIPLRFLGRDVARDAVHSTAKSACIVYQVCYLEYLCNELYRSTFLGDLLGEFVRNSGYLSHKLSITEGRSYLYLLQGADLRTIGGVQGAWVRCWTWRRLPWKWNNGMSPCDGTGVPLLRWVRFMFTYHTTYTFIYIQRIGPPPASAAQNSLIWAWY